MTQMNLSTKQKRLTDIETCSCQGEGGGGMGWELGLSDANYFIENG